MPVPQRLMRNGVSLGTVWLAMPRNAPREPETRVERRCGCGAIIARDNRAAQCSPCQRRR